MSVIRKTNTQSKNNDSPLEFIFSDNSVDAYDDAIDQNGWILDDFNKNSIALLGHDPNFVIGRWLNVRVEGGRLRGHLQLAPEGTSARIDEVRKLIFAGILKSCSVGFVPVESMPRPGSKKGGQLYKKQILREVSVCAIPANSNALMLEARALGVSSNTIKAVFRQSVNASLAERQARARESIKRAKATIARVEAAQKTWKKDKRENQKLLTMSPQIKAQYSRAAAVRERALAVLAGRPLPKTAEEIAHEHALKVQANKAIDAWMEKAKRSAPRSRMEPVYDYFAGTYVGLTWRGQKIPRYVWNEDEFDDE